MVVQNKVEEGFWKNRDTVVRENYSKDVIFEQKSNNESASHIEVWATYFWAEGKRHANSESGQLLEHLRSSRKVKVTRPKVWAFKKKTGGRIGRKRFR